MERFEKSELLRTSDYLVASFYDDINNLNSINLNDLETSKTALVIVDVINGFIREGALHSTRIENIVQPIKKLMLDCKQKSIKIIAFADCHDKNAAEFETFPEHCVSGTSESLIIDELEDVGGYTLINKNSTNGFHADTFQKFSIDNADIDNFIVCGDCTDICVMNFCISLKTFFDSKNLHSNIVIPINAVETYSGGNHDGDFMNVMALKFMQNAGIKLVSEVE